MTEAVTDNDAIGELDFDHHPPCDRITYGATNARCGAPAVGYWIKNCCGAIGFACKAHATDRWAKTRLYCSQCHRVFQPIASKWVPLL